ncbi:MAG: aspartate--tRNA ligase [Chitinispirillaceae bacterium]|nr:aspartate--tRNA ligase [Chitinispirillaceae bacterium]
MAVLHDETTLTPRTGNGASSTLLNSTYRTHTCGALREGDVGKTARLSGWIHSKRDHGGVLFIDLRDHYGITQVVIHPEHEFQRALAHMSKESVVQFTGKVEMRSEETVNTKIPTGTVELVADSYELLGSCTGTPFAVFPEDPQPEDLRLTYRYLDLRRSKLHHNIVLRSQIIAHAREVMTALGFNEFQTPILTCSSPEGARDFLVPSRLHPGTFYALPQAPQQFKQLLMVAGFDRYFQIAPCFRDEDARADRSPGEFYQLDIEMAFVTQEEVFAVVEQVLHGLFTRFSEKSIDDIPFKKIPYKEAMLKYGTDKPDLRNPLEIQDISDVFAGSGFKVFSRAVAEGGAIRTIFVKGCAAQPRSFFDRMVDYASSLGMPGIAYLTWTDSEVKGPIVKFLDEERLAAIKQQVGAEAGDVAFFICDSIDRANELSGQIRTKLGTELGLIEKNTFRFCWITDFPMFERNPEHNRIDFSHNPFSMPQGGLESLETKDPLDVLAYQYDIVCNGIELSSGAIRNHRPDVMFKAFEIAGYTKKEVEEQFSGMINAFTYGAPPHGGIAPGIDRMVMLLAEEPNIREVIAFPMNQKAQDLMMKAPAEVSEQQLRDLHLRTVTT